MGLGDASPEESEEERSEASGASAAQPEAPSQSESASPTDAAFVDEATLDADLDELAIPFGAGAALSDVLPTTPAYRDPEVDNSEAPSPPASEPPEFEEPVEEQPVTDEFAPEDSEVLPPEDPAPSAQSASEGAPVPPPDPGPSQVAGDVDEAGEPGPVIERVGPSAEFGALLAEPPDERPVPADPGAPDPFGDLDLSEDPPPVTTPEGGFEDAVLVTEAPPPPETDSAEQKKGGFPWWLVALAAVLALALLLAWLWPRLAARSGGETAPTEQVTTSPTALVGTDRVTNEPAPDPVPVGVTAPATSRRAAPAASGGGAPRDPGPSPALPGLSPPPAATYPVPPLRSASLLAADARALSGDVPVDAKAHAWTLVVLSTASRDDASALSARYRGAGYRAAVLPSGRGGRPVYRVAVGQFADRAQASRLAAHLPPQVPANAWSLDLRTL